MQMVFILHTCSEQRTIKLVVWWGHCVWSHLPWPRQWWAIYYVIQSGGGQLEWCDDILRCPPSRVPGVILPRYLMQLCQYSHH